MVLAKRRGNIGRFALGLTPPDADEIEVSLFGPGFGECVVLHLGAGAWVVIDSCLDENEPVALRYLQLMGLSAAKSVHLVVASHWHDDHVEGLSRLLKACPNSRFAMSAALHREEFAQLVECFGKTDLMLQSSGGLEELAKALDIVRARRRHPEWASFNRNLWNVGDVQLSVLSPSDKTITRAQLSLARLIPQRLSPKKPLPNPGPNELSVALWLRAGNLEVLLGADLEHNGWKDLLENPMRPQTRAGLEKVPHHGAESAHHDGVYSDLLEPLPWAVMTPFVNGSVLLPTSSDQDRIRTRTSVAYLTAPPARKQSKHPTTVSKSLRQMNMKLYQRPLDVGYIRLRAKLGSSRWDVFRSAGSVCLHGTGP